jgi:hypothetical protein
MNKTQKILEPNPITEDNQVTNTPVNVIKIYSNPLDFTEGIFGQCLTWLLEVLNYLENSKTINDNTQLSFNINTLNNRNLIPKFIQPLKIIDESFKAVEISLKHFKIDVVPVGFKLSEESFDKANRIFNKYFKFNDFILDEVNKLNITNKTLGIHYRGTDKLYDKNQANSITRSDMILIVKDYVENNDIDHIFCCSDEQLFINEIKRIYPNKLIQYEQSRSNEDSVNYGFFRNGHKCNDRERDALTYSCIIDMLALSKCTTIIKTSSALSSFSKILNPSLKLYTVSSMKQPWFPTAVANIYEPYSEEIKKILKRTMINDCYNQ